MGSTTEPTTERSQVKSEPSAEEIRKLSRDLACYPKAYARDNPAAAALFCFGVGFVLGWKLKPW